MSTWHFYINVNLSTWHLRRSPKHFYKKPVIVSAAVLPVIREAISVVSYSHLSVISRFPFSLFRCFMAGSSH